MKILQIATPQQPVFAAFALRNKKNVPVIEIVPVLFFGLIPITKGPEGKMIENEATIEPLVYNFQGAGATIATSHKNFLGIEVRDKGPTTAHKDWNKELISFVAQEERQDSAPITPEVKIQNKPAITEKER